MDEIDFPAADLRLHDVSLGGVDAGSGNRFHFVDVSGSPVFDVDDWATENSSGRDAYAGGVPVEISDALSERVDALVERWSQTFDHEAYAQAVQTLVEQSIAAMEQDDLDDEGALMCENCRDAVSRGDGVMIAPDGETTQPCWIGSDGETRCPGSRRPHGPAVRDTADEDDDPHDEQGNRLTPDWADEHPDDTPGWRRRRVEDGDPT